MKKFMRSRNAFNEVKGEEEREFLNIFSFIAMLSFDVYLKKAMIEKIIDELLVPAQEERKTKKDGGKKTAKGDGKKEDAAEEAKDAE